MASETNKIDSRSRNLANRKLSNDIPRPNIVRIEMLDGDARARYLTGIYSGSNTLRNAMYQNIVPTGQNTFYGFLSPNSDFTFNMTGGWESSSLGGMAMGGIKKIADGVGAGKLVGGLFSAGQTAYEIASSLTQLNATATGSSTMQDFKSVSLDQFSVSCVWYIPEQEKIARTSLRILYRMLYPRQVDADKAADLLGKVAGNAVKKVAEAGEQAINKLTATESEDLKSNVNKPAAADSSSNDNGGLVSSVINITEAGVTGGVKALNTVGTFFGYNVTANPLPVRVCIGQYIDVEPLVITSIETKFSRETFISENSGRHLPLFAYTTVHFKYWLNPAPNLQFANILGEEIFGN